MARNPLVPASPRSRHSPPRDFAYRVFPWHIPIRYERKVENYLAFVQLASVCILLRRHFRMTSTVTNAWKQRAVPVSPADGAVLDTLIPTLTYRSIGSYADTTMCVAFDVNPHPTWCSIYTSYDPARMDSALLWTNLLPSTTYYWRVATIFDMSSPDRLWSEEWSFQTAPAGGVILPAPNLVSPVNGGAITLNQAILNWSAVTGAVEYRIYVSEQGVSGDLVYFQNTNSPLDVSGDSQYLLPGHTHKWYVVARNDYTLGQPSSTWSFTISASSATQALGRFGFR